MKISNASWSITALNMVLFPLLAKRGEGKGVGMAFPPTVFVLPFNFRLFTFNSALLQSLKKF
jgi:hypothetical protein